MTTLTLTERETTLVDNVVRPQVAHPRSAYATVMASSSVATSHDSSDEDLLGAIREGAEWALEQLYARYGRFAFALAYRLLRESAAAEDIVQEAFLAIWRKANCYRREQGSFISWLQAIVHHRAIDRLRAASSRDSRWTPLENEHEPERISGQPDVWEEAWESERRRLILQALSRLSAEQRQVIELGYFGGYTHSEIAERWQIPLGTVKGRMRLGLLKLRHLLCEYGIEGL